MLLYEADVCFRRPQSLHNVFRDAIFGREVDLDMRRPGLRAWVERSTCLAGAKSPVEHLLELARVVRGEQIVVEAQEVIVVSIEIVVS